MDKKICILGTGKMAENIGLFFLGKSADVHFISSDEERLVAFEESIFKKYKRLIRISGEDNIGTLSIGAVSTLRNKKIDFVIESTAEDIVRKKSIVSKVKRELPQVICFSNSSSIKAEKIDPEIIGLHFFYPVELTGIVEIINDKKMVAENFVKKFGLNSINENEDRSFLVNRLLLPMQSEAFRLLKKGYNREVVNISSTSDLMVFGQLSMMDNIGFDTIYKAALNYLHYLEVEERKDYEPLISGLEELFNLDEMSEMYKSSLLGLENLPWKNVKSDKHPEIPFGLILINNCFKFIEKKLTDINELDLIFNNIFMSDISFGDVLKKIDFKKSEETLKKIFDREGLSYFSPSMLWKKVEIVND